MSLFRKNKMPDIVKIGFWGPPGSGKSTYITMLPYSDDLDGWSIKPKGQETQQLLLEYSELLRDKMEFIPPTIVDKIQYLTFDLEQQPNLFQKRSLHIVLPEASGEYYEKPDEYPELIDELFKCNSVIWLIDPLRIDNPEIGTRSYRRMIQEWLYRLYEMQNGGILKQKMAFCLTKMDLPIYSEYIEDPRNFCLDKLGSDIEKFLVNYCNPNDVNFFATSSIGFLPNTETSVIDPQDPSKLIGAANPFNLFSPIKWIIEKTY